MFQGVFHTGGESGGGGRDSREGLWPVPAELVQHQARFHHDAVETCTFGGTSEAPSAASPLRTRELRLVRVVQDKWTPPINLPHLL
jgi:hypothetical protein